MSQWQTAGKVRMTPKGTWIASTAYVVLDCVSNTDKTAYYVAKKDVPAGTVLTNTEYWDVVNDISDIVSQLTNEIERLEDIVALGYPTVSGAGEFVNIEGTIDAPLSELTIYGKSVQSDGTPTPSDPIDIVTAGSGGTLAMVSAGKNLLIPKADGTYTQQGITYVVSDGSISVSGTYTGSAFSVVVFGNCVLPPGSYRFNGQNGVDSGNYKLTLQLFNLDTNQQIVNLDRDTDYTFTLNAAANIQVRIGFRAGLALSEPAVMTPMIRPATITDAAFAPYNCVASVIDTTPNGLPGIPVASGGNYTDTDGQMWICDTIDLEAGTWTKRCGVVTLDGSENWIASTQVAGRYYLASTYTPNAVPYANHLCTHAVANPGSSTSDTGKSFFASGANFDINTEYASVDAFKAALAANNMTLIYQLAAPVVEQLTTAQLTALRSLRGRKGQTNLYSADPAGPEFRAEMYIDIPTYINSLVN